ncbi:hypothetical protein DHEL01_v206789 [Diaporthe helianthi]|uniref:Uncharacterized protein n=1 Tax=Diaporthe helianthi TaxID=158607 RepID=A0A2P5HX65_DIAHE|nr:hypothetical protein DHEL01_v206789 [Diaporthe helianthi]
MSPEHKRTSQEDGTDEKSGHGDHLFKKTKLSMSSSGGDETAVVGRHLNAALDFINSCGLASKAPESLQPLLESRPNAAEGMAQQIKARIYDTWEPLCSDTSGRQTGIRSSDLSSAQCSHFPAIERLARLPSEHSLRLAYEVAWYLKDNSYGDMDEDRGFGNRPSDEQGDALLSRLIRDRRAAGDSWDCKRDLVSIDQEAHHMASHSVDCWYPETRALLREALCSASQGTTDKDSEKQQDPVPSKDKLTKANLDMFSAYEKDRTSKYFQGSCSWSILVGVVLQAELTMVNSLQNMANSPTPKQSPYTVSCLPNPDPVNKISSVEAYMHIYIYIYIYMCVCVCVCSRSLSGEIDTDVSHPSSRSKPTPKGHFRIDRTCVDDLDLSTDRIVPTATFCCSNGTPAPCAATFHGIIHCSNAPRPSAPKRPLRLTVGAALRAAANFSRPPLFLFLFFYSTFLSIPHLAYVLRQTGLLVRLVSLPSASPPQTSRCWERLCIVLISLLSNPIWHWKALTFVFFFKFSLPLTQWDASNR